MKFSGALHRLDQFWLGPRDPIRLETFRVLFGLTLLLYMSVWWQDATEWLTPIGFHVSSAAAGAYAPVAPLLPLWALPLFGVMLIGSLVAFVIGWQLRWIKWLVLAEVLYVTYADPLAAYTLNRLYMAGLAVLAFVPLGAYWSVRGDPAVPRSVWPVRVLQATLLSQYFTAGWCKAVHGGWLSDPYVLWSQIQGWYRTDIAAWMLTTLPLAIWPVLQWAALLFELLAPILLGVRRLRPLAFVLGGGFQLIVAFTMHQLIYFTVQMLSFYVLFVDDATLHRARARLLRTFGRGEPSADEANTAAPVEP